MISAALTRWSDVALGAAVRTGENAADAFAGLRDKWTIWETDGRALRQRLVERGAALAERGAAERTRTVAATSRILDQIIDAQLDRVLRLLETKPERIRALVRGQRENVVDEVVGRMRAGAAAGDDAVDRLTFRMGRHTPAEPR